MNRWIGVAIFLLGILVGVLIWYGSSPSLLSKDQSYNFILADRPGAYCPTSAEIVYIDSSPQQASSFYSETAQIKGCEIVEGIVPFGSGTYQVLVKLPGARATELSVTWPLTSDAVIPVLLGDINSDNHINSTDLQLVENSLRSGANGADVDGDNTTTILDYSIVTINQGIGINRPDNGDWSL